RAAGELLGLTGLAAKNSVAEMARRLEAARRESEKAFDSPGQREAFGQAWQGIQAAAMAAARAHEQSQAREYSLATLAAQNQQLAEEAAAAAARPDGERAVLAGPAQEMVYNNAVHMAALSGRDAGAAARENLRAFHGRQLDSIARKRPAAALAYLENGQVRPLYSEDEYQALADAYRERGRELDASRREAARQAEAEADARAGLSEREAWDKYSRNAGGDRDAAWPQMEAYHNAKARVQSEAIAQKAERETAIRQAYINAGFDMARMEAGAGGAAAGGEGGTGGEGLELTARERRRLAEWGRKVLENGGREGGEDVSYLLDLQAKPAWWLQAYLTDNDGRGMEELLEKGGGLANPQVAAVIAMARGQAAGTAPLAKTPAGWAARRLATDEGWVIGKAGNQAAIINTFARRFDAAVRDRAKATGKQPGELGQATLDELYARLRIAGNKVDGGPGSDNGHDWTPEYQRGPYRGGFGVRPATFDDYDDLGGPGPWSVDEDGDDVDEGGLDLSAAIKEAKRYIDNGWDVQEFIWDNQLSDDVAAEVLEAIKDYKPRRRKKGGKRAAKRVVFDDYDDLGDPGPWSVDEDGEDVGLEDGEGDLA
ncbi:MAG: hypothetical protein LBU23_08705, partial [Planctomycetota bacterium]|nr:hypothetical protein [Planctomycetota bacterium]